jgi:hypothetical protein
VGALNVFIDGTWLLNQLAGGRSMANATDHPDSRFFLDFAKLTPLFSVTSTRTAIHAR